MQDTGEGNGVGSARTVSWPGFVLHLRNTSNYDVGLVLGYAIEASVLSPWVLAWIERVPSMIDMSLLGQAI
jgi:hypothetical protein